MLGRFAVYVLMSSALLAGCGGASTTATHGRRVVLQPGPNALAHVRVTLPQTPPVHAPTKAEIRTATAQFRTFVNKHCPCELEQTAHGIRVLSQAHP
jgi:hypothetical protein